MGIFSSIPKWAQTLFGNRLVTEQSPYGNGDMSILLATMRYAQLNGKIVKKIDFFDKKFGFFNRKISVFGKKINFFYQKTAIPHRQPQYTLKFLRQIFPTAKQGFPFLHSRMCQAPFLYGDPRMETGTRFFKSPYGNGDSPFAYRDVSIPVSILGSPYGNVFGGRFFWQCDGAWCVTQRPAKTTVPVSIRGVPIWKRAGRLRNSYLGTPRYQTEFVTIIWGLTYSLYGPTAKNSATICFK